ncbi:MAG: TlyA family RNA methyltransferase [Candidatus Liptonbacteria bacterium]|nr:TlyA family RNA methyltransferase [Candidatus Liptonbacteria bacterium]
MSPSRKALKLRLDTALLEQGLAKSPTEALALIMSGVVTVDGQSATKPGCLVPEDAWVAVAQSARFVSRAGDKLEAALATFQLNVQGKVCADVGASTGGFTDCLLQHGAAKVYAIDVGHGLLDPKLRADPRVAVRDGTNVRHLEKLPEPIALVVADLSFISLKLVLPVFRGWFSEHGEMVVLIKPQFEASEKEASQGKGVISDPEIHRRVLSEVLGAAVLEGYGVRGLILSPIEGKKGGNREFLAWLGYPKSNTVDISALVGQTVK